MAKTQPAARKTILVADDDATVNATLTTYLKSLGYSTKAVADGEAAMKAIEESRPDLLILDIAMPEASGIVVARWVRAHGERAIRETPIIMLTARSDKRHEAYSNEAGANTFVPKPVTLAELAGKIRELL